MTFFAMYAAAYSSVLRPFPQALSDYGRIMETLAKGLMVING